MGFMDSFLGKLELTDEEAIDNGDYLDGEEPVEEPVRPASKVNAVP